MGCKQKDDAPAAPDDRPRALYVHVPFCRAKCRYCDFYSVPVTDEQARRYVSAVAGELADRGSLLAGPAESVFLGGGTPSCLPVDALRRLLSLVGPWIGEATEVSAEVNPATLTPERIDALLAGRVNRINVGVQSLSDAELAALGRLHRSAEACEAVRAIRSAGCDNVGLDLIYGIPGQSLDDWRHSLQGALDLEPSHLSCYALSFEEGTPLTADLRAGRVAEVPDQLQREMYETAIDTAEAAGLEHYEISNFARPHRRCRHNLVYWHNRPYLGLGPGAASYVGGIRSVTRPDVEAYLEAIESGRAPSAESEQLTGRRRVAETLMLELRLREGADLGRLAQMFGADAVGSFMAVIDRLADMGAVERDGGRVAIRREYLFVSDAILAEIVADADREFSGDSEQESL